MTLIGNGGPGEENVDAGDGIGDGAQKGHSWREMIGDVSEQLRLEIEERCVDISVLLCVNGSIFELG